MPDVHFDISQGDCFCAAPDRCIEPSLFIGVNHVHGRDLSLFKSAVLRNSARIQDRIDNMKAVLNAWNTLELNDEELFELSKTVNASIRDIRLLTSKLHSVSAVIAQELHLTKAKLANQKRQEPTSTVSSLLTTDPATPTFVPPPKTDITPELMNQSLNSQAQNEAIADSVIPDFINGNLTFMVQMDGIVAARIPINASIYLPCGGIGKTDNVDIMIVPKYVNDGTNQTTVADCMVIAINMYTPDIYTYWVRTADGETISVTGTNRIHDINQIYTGGPLELRLHASTDSSKRSVSMREPEDCSVSKLIQIFPTDCREGCSKSSKTFIQGIEDFCGCLERTKQEKWNTRGLYAPDVGDATMSAEACAAMRCINNNNQPAIYNQFTRTCWCQDPTYVEEISNGWSGRVRSLISKLGF